MKHDAPPSLEEWRPLYEVMDRVKEAAPWEWMTETDVFGVLDPETGEPGFVSVMGQLGEHYALTLYLGAEGLYRFWEIQNAGPYLQPEMILNTPQIQASFENRNDVPAKDRDIIKQLGRKYRGQQAWPLFQNFTPGMVPWQLTAAEARFMHHALEQALDVAARYKEDAGLLDTDDDTKYLVRVPRQKNGRWQWHDELQKIPPPGPKEYHLLMDLHALAILEKARPTTARVDVDFFWTPAPVGERGERPYYPYTLFMVDPQSGMILGADTLIADPTPEDMWASVPKKVVQLLARTKTKPQAIRVLSPPLASFLEPVAQRIGCQINLVDTLPELEAAKNMMMGFLMR